jgi:DNA-binding XRE family transcriptional regulator
MKHNQLRQKLLARKGVKDAYEAMSEEFAALDVLLKARKQAKRTQEEVAARMGTTKSAVSRLESSLTSEKPFAFCRDAAQVCAGVREEVGGEYLVGLTRYEHCTR